jgi:hypothetical protein
MPTIRSTENLAAENANSHEIKCEICLDPLWIFDSAERVLVTPCQHSFHEGCISDWVRQFQVCQMCQKTLQLKDLKVLPRSDLSPTTENNLGLAPSTSAAARQQQVALEAQNTGAVPKTHPHNTRHKKISQAEEPVEDNQPVRNAKGLGRPKRGAANSEGRQTRRGGSANARANRES